MSYRTWKSCLSALLLLMGVAAPSMASADEVRLLTANFPPLTDDSGAKKGLIHDMVVEMAKIMKVKSKIEFMDWTVAQATAQKDPDILIFPMTRTPKREGDYIWVAKLFNQDRSFIGKPGSKPVDSLEQAGKLKAVGTVANSASAGFLKEKALANVVLFPNPKDLIKALVDGQVEAVYQPNVFTKAEWNKLGQPAPVVGKPIEVNESYLALGKNAKSVKVEDWRAAFEVVQQDGTFERLVKEYGVQ